MIFMIKTLPTLLCKTPKLLCFVFEIERWQQYLSQQFYTLLSANSELIPFTSRVQNVHPEMKSCFLSKTTSCGTTSPIIS